MDLIDQLQTLANRAEQASESLTNEEATKMALIAPFIQALGYDIFNPVEVKPEFSADLPGIKQGERVDYAILEDGHPKILIEAKPYTSDLRTAEMGQLSRYFQATKARIGILTNGRLFQFFSDLDDRNLMDQKPFAALRDLVTEEWNEGGFGDFYSIFLDEGRGGRNKFDRSDLQKAMSFPRAAGFFIRK